MRQREPGRTLHAMSKSGLRWPPAAAMFGYRLLILSDDYVMEVRLRETLPSYELAGLRELTLTMRVPAWL